MDITHITSLLGGIALFLYLDLVTIIRKRGGSLLCVTFQILQKIRKFHYAI